MRFVMAFLAPLSLAGSASAQTAPEQVQIELSSFAFAPSAVSLQRGHAYRLHLVNSSSGGHDFSAPRFFEASQIAPNDAGKVQGGKVSVPGHATADVSLIPQASGSYPLRCTHFMHSAFGMKGSIVVR